MSLKGDSVLVRRIQLPKMTPEELKNAIRFEAENQIPFPIDDCFMDFQILDAMDEKSMAVLLAVAKKETVLQRLELLKAVGVSVELVDLDLCCLVNAAQILLSGEMPDGFGLLHIGRQSSLLVIMRKGFPHFMREIMIGETARDELAAELKQSVDYFESENGEEVKSIFLSGGGALAAGAAEQLSHALGRPAALWDATKKIELADTVDAEFFKAHAAEWTLALGLAARKVIKP